MAGKYITEEERRKCTAVMESFQELYDKWEVVTLDAGKYGFVVMEWCLPEIGYEHFTVFRESKEMFEYLWMQWRDCELFCMIEEVEWKEEDLDEQYHIMAERHRQEFEAKRSYFWQKYLENL